MKVEDAGRNTECSFQRTWFERLDEGVPSRLFELAAAFAENAGSGLVELYGYALQRPRPFSSQPTTHAGLFGVATLAGTCELGSISTFENPADVSDRAPKCAIARGVVTQSSEAYELSNVVETALARALVLAAEAGRWDVVMQITEELGRRRPRQTGEQGTTGQPTRHGRRFGVCNE